MKTAIHKALNMDESGLAKMRRAAREKIKEMTPARTTAKILEVIQFVHQPRKSKKERGRIYDKLSSAWR
jgi:hypothetical protein